MQFYPCAECFAEQTLATQSLTALLRNMPELKGIFCTGYTSTAGAITALKQTNRKDVVLVGFDTSTELLTALRQGWCDVLLYQNPYRQGYATIETLTRYVVDGIKPSESKTLTRTHIVLRQNADQYQ